LRPAPPCPGGDGKEEGTPPVSGIHPRPALASYQDTVIELMRDGTPFEDVEDAINAHPGMTDEQKSAMWLYAFSLQGKSKQQRDARAHLTAVDAATGDGELVEAAREQARAEHYERYQWEPSGADAHATGHARPLEFDANGFPVPQHSRTFFERVSRLLNPQ
jgi:hypothetical protein